MAGTTTSFDATLIKTAISWRMLRQLNGKAFCLTGKMSLSRGELGQLINMCDGQVHDAVKSNTNYLIVPNEPGFREGSKFKAAQTRGTTIITEEEFCGMILPTVEELLK